MLLLTVISRLDHFYRHFAAQQASTLAAVDALDGLVSEKRFVTTNTR
jgi:hypothetical protein